MDISPDTHTLRWERFMAMSEPFKSTEPWATLNQTQHTEAFKEIRKVDNGVARVGRGDQGES